MPANLREYRSIKMHAIIHSLAIFVMGTALYAQSTAGQQEPNKQLPADRRAIRAAGNFQDPELRATAMRNFIRDYPKSIYVATARQTLLKTMLKYFPDRAGEIHELCQTLRKQEHSGFDRWDEEIYLADSLAEAGPSGVDLATASAFLQDAEKHITEDTFRKEQLKRYREWKLDLPEPEKIRKPYEHKRAEILAVKANIAIKQERLADAAALLSQAEALQPMLDEVYYLRGEIAVKEHRNADALVAFERAQVVGEIPPAERTEMMTLYRESHNGSEAGLDDDLDKQYATLHPKAFEPAAHTPGNGGHTALLELFTGSACGPCVGGDLAVEALLEAYSRTEVVALAFDQHVPAPDPLANPSSIARAEIFKVHSTPSYSLDGAVLPIYGADRDGAAELYKKLVRLVDVQTARASAVQLTLTEAEPKDGSLRARAEVRLEAEPSLRALSAQETATWPPSNDDDKTTAKGKADAAKTGTADKPADAPALPQLELVFALVEDEVRYSGENGVRFHRMVVRSMKSGEGTELKPRSTATATVSFDPAEITKTNRTYLDSYAKEHGSVEFLSTNTVMQPEHLSIAAWVQDKSTHRVLQAAFLPGAATPVLTRAAAQ